MKDMKMLLLKHNNYLDSLSQNGLSFLRLQKC